MPAQFWDRLRLRLSNPAAPNANAIERFADSVLGPFHNWSTTSVGDPGGPSPLALTGSTTDGTLGDGTLTGGWRELGDLVFIHIYYVIGSTTTLPTGQWSWSLPFAAHASYAQSIGGSVMSSTVGHRYAIVGNVPAGGSTTINRVLWPGGSWTDTSPFAMVAGDAMVLEGFYRPA